jgi:hypothetical protein
MGETAETGRKVKSQSVPNAHDPVSFMFGLLNDVMLIFLSQRRADNNTHNNIVFQPAARTN